MRIKPAAHPPPDQLTAFGLGKLDDTAAETVGRHLETCPDCRRLAAAVPADEFLLRIRDANSRDVTPVPTHTFTGPAPVPPALLNLPDYEVVRELGRGGMGVVYLARNKLMDRLEVLKVLGRGLVDNQVARDRFLREIRSAARLTHPNVVAAYTAVQSGDLLALAMEYVPGEDLAKLVRAAGPLPVAAACEYARQAALGLQHAHEKGMAHRDIKPHNLILVRNGPAPVVKVLDFGLAKATSEERAETVLTGAGKMLGTPDYMAPEQIRDATAADIRADVYSLGCTLYHLLAGRPPFEATNLYSLLGAHQNTEPELLSKVRPEVPPGLALVVAKMLAKAPADRHQTPADVAAALAPFAQPTAPRRRLVAGVAAGFLAVVLLAAAAGVFKVKTKDGTLVLEDVPDNAVVLVDGEVVTVAWDRDGKRGEVKVRPGEHKVRVTKDGVTVAGKEVEVEDGGRRVLSARLEPPNADPPAAAKPAPPQPPPAKDPGPGPQPQKDPTPAPQPPAATPAPQPPKARSIRNYAAPNLFTVSGDWRVEGGELVQASTGPNVYFFFGDSAWEDYDLELEGKRGAGPEGFKVLFRAVDSQNFHAFGLGSYGNKRHEVFRVEDRTWHLNADQIPGGLDADHWYKIRVEARGKTFRCFADGKKVFEFSDPHFPRGRIGLGTWATTARFKNLKVTAADGKTVLLDKWPEIPKPAAPGTRIPAADRKADAYSDKGFWRAGGGELLFGAEELSNSWLLFGDPAWTDYDFQVLAVRENSGTSGVSLLFRSAGPGVGNTGLFNQGMGGNRYGGIEFNLPGQALAKEVGGVALPVNDGPKGRFVNGSWYALKVEVRGAVCKCYVDDELLYTFDKVPFPSGRVGLRVGRSIFRFRDIRVTAPNGTLLWAGLPDLPPTRLPVPAVFGAFVPLLNGKDLTGWTTDQGKPNWAVADGVLANKTGGVIYTEKSFGDFSLKFEFQITPETLASVDLWAVPGDTPNWVFLDNTRDALGAITFDGREKGFYVNRLKPPAELRPEGEWNDAVIDLRNGVLSVWLNGRALGTADIRKHVEARRPNLSAPERFRGRIGLNKRWGRGTVRIRNLSILESTDPRFSIPTGVDRPVFGEWQVKDNELIQKNWVWGSRLVFGDATWTDYDFRVEAMMADRNCGFGMMVRNTGFNLKKNPQDGTDRYSDYAMFVVGAYGNSHHSLEQARDGKIEELAKTPLDPDHRLKKGEWVPVRVSVRGSRVQCYINDERVYDVTTKAPAAGYVGLMTWDAPFRFRNISVTDPAGKVLLDGSPDLGG